MKPLIKKFRAFEKVHESINDNDMSSAEVFAFLEAEGVDVNEGILSSIKNYFSRMLGGKIKKLDDILNRYKENETEYWVKWADAQSKFNKADILSATAKSDPAEKLKHGETKNRTLKLKQVVEDSRKQTNSALFKQADVLVRGNERLKDYWELQKAMAEEQIAKDSHEQAKTIADEHTIDQMYANIDDAIEEVKKKDKAFVEKYGDIKEPTSNFFDFDKPEHRTASTSKEDAAAFKEANIKNVGDFLYARFSNDFQSKLLGMSKETLKVVVDYFAREIKKVKDRGDAEQEPIVNLLQKKLDYINEILKLGHAVAQNPDIVTATGNKELGDKKDAAVSAAIENTAKKTEGIPLKHEVESTIDKLADDFFDQNRSTIEAAVGKIDDTPFKHLVNDLTALFGKLLFYYKQTDEGKVKNVSSMIMRIGLTDFAGKLFLYKKDEDALNRDLSQSELQTKFDEYEK